MHGVINLDKPKGITSQDAVTLVKRALRVKKAGHAGTLDPMATGVLLVSVGEATKIARFLQDLDKEYVAELKLGERTDTLDAEGRVIETKKVPPLTIEDVEKALARFRGEITQIPPMYSALKREGKPLYELARKGIEVEREARTVKVYGLSLLRLEPPFMEISVSCSKGTYIRTLADDLGVALGTLAHITKLRRTAIGGIRAEDAVSPETLTEKDVIPVDRALSHLKEISLSGREFDLVSKGTEIIYKGPALETIQFIRIKGPDGKLFGVGSVSPAPLPKLRVERLLFL